MIGVDNRFFFIEKLSNIYFTEFRFDKIILPNLKMADWSSLMYRKKQINLTFKKQTCVKFKIIFIKAENFSSHPIFCHFYLSMQARFVSFECHFTCPELFGGFFRQFALPWLAWQCKKNKDFFCTSIEI